jgi:hypothetical protein
VSHSSWDVIKTFPSFIPILQGIKVTVASIVVRPLIRPRIDILPQLAHRIQHQLDALKKRIDSNPRHPCGNTFEFNMQFRLFYRERAADEVFFELFVGWQDLERLWG